MARRAPGEPSLAPHEYSCASCVCGGGGGLSLPEPGSPPLALGAQEDEVTSLLDPVHPDARDLAASSAMLEGDIGLEGLSLKEDPAARE